MPLAMATILNVNIIIFIKNSHSPMYVTSLTDPSEKTVFLIYDPEGPGHYDAALPYSYMNNNSNKASIESEIKFQVSCSCGVNKKNSHHHVHLIHFMLRDANAIKLLNRVTVAVVANTVVIHVE